MDKEKKKSPNPIVDAEIQTTEKKSYEYQDSEKKRKEERE